MTAKEIVKKIMEDTETTNAEMAASLKISQAAVWDRLNPKKTDNLTVNTLDAMLRHLNYKIVVVPYNKRVLDGEYEVE